MILFSLAAISFNIINPLIQNKIIASDVDQTNIYVNTDIPTNNLVSSLNIDTLLINPVFTGILFYGVGLVGLTLFEEFVVPKLKLNSILPDIPISDNQLTEFQKKESWIIPLTADYSVPLPEKTKLKIKGKHRIGSRNGISQFITLDTNLKTIKNVQERSEEWSEVYNENIIIFKKNKWN